MLIGCSGVTIDIQYLQDNLPVQVTAEIEERGFHLAKAGDLEAVYYLARVDSATHQVRVGYFLVWPGEYPDFGNDYPARLRELAAQLLNPSSLHQLALPAGHRRAPAAVLRSGRC